MKNLKRTVVLALITLCFATVLCVVCSAQNLSDIEGHWAKEYIEYGIEKGYIKGYTDNTFKPDNPVTRAEFSKMINSAVGIKRGVSINFTDVDSDDWFYPEVMRAVFASYTKGYEDGTFRPNVAVTRQEAAVILSRIVLPSEKRTDLSVFKDKEKISDWAQDSVSMILAKGYIKGDEQSNFLPSQALTRCQAAKIIAEFVQNENIVADEVKIEKSETVSETLFTSNVTVDVSAENAKVVFENCRVLGNVDLASRNTQIQLVKTNVDGLYVNAETGAQVFSDEESAVKYLYVYYPAKLEGNAFGTVVLSGEDLASGIVELEGDVDTVNVEGNTIIKITDGTVDKINVNKKANVIIQSGKVNNLTVEKDATDSVINIASKVDIDNVVNNAPVSYVGTGTIKNAYNAVVGVTYETSPEKVSGKVTVDEDDIISGDEDFFEYASISPTNGKTNVSVSSIISVYFEKEVADKYGEKLTEEYLEDAIELRKKSVNGTKVDIAVIVNSENRFTIYPAIDLENSTKYYLVFPKGTLMYSEDSTVNAQYSTYFTTVASTDGSDSNTGTNVTVSFTPSNGATKVALNSTIKISFSGRVYAKGKNDLTSTFVENSAIQLRKGSTNGTLVDFEATVPTNSTSITLTPETLEPNATYYVVIVANQLQDSAGNYLSYKTSKFTTENNLPVTVTPVNKATNVSAMPEIVLSFSEPVVKTNGNTLTDEYVEDEVVVIRTSTSTSGQTVGFDAQVDSKSQKITIIPTEELQPGKTYYVVVNAGSLCGRNSGAENKALTSSFTVAKTMAPVITPANGSENVSISTDIEVTFSDKLYIPKSNTVAMSELTSNYVKENDVVTLRRRSATGTEVDCDVHISDDGKTIILEPSDSLATDYTYYVVVKASMICNYSGNKNTASSASFSTNEAVAPTFSPENGAEKVSLTSKLKVTFNESVYNLDGEALTGTYVANKVLRFYMEEVDEDNYVDCAVTLSSDKKTVTVTPDKKLQSGTEYILVLLADTMTNKSGVLIPEYKVSFTTETIISKDITFTPANKTAKVRTDVNPVVEFASPIYRYNGLLTEKYAAENIYLRQGSSSSGTIIEATVEISNDNKTFTIIPTEPLKEKTRYYICVKANKFVYEDEKTSVSSANAYFDTVDKMPALSAVSYKEVTDESATIEYTSNCKGTVYVEAVSEDDTKKVSAKCVAGTATLKLEGLLDENTYEVSIYVVDENGIESEKILIGFTTPEK